MICNLFEGEDIPGTRRLPGYSIRVSNDTNVPPPEWICYQDPENTVLDNILQNDCERTAQYVDLSEQHIYWMVPRVRDL